MRFIAGKGDAAMNGGFSEPRETMDQKLEQVYTETVIDHALNPRNLGAPREWNARANYKGPCGDTIEIWLNVRGNTIIETGFWTDGCGTTIACGSMVTELAKGRTRQEALKIGQREVLEHLGGLPPESEHCALLEATALKLTIAEYLGREGYGFYKH